MIGKLIRHFLTTVKMDLSKREVRMKVPRSSQVTVILKMLLVSTFQCMYTFILTSPIFVMKVIPINGNSGHNTDPISLLLMQGV